MGLAISVYLSVGTLDSAGRLWWVVAFLCFAVGLALGAIPFLFYSRLRPKHPAWGYALAVVPGFAVVLAVTVHGLPEALVLAACSGGLVAVIFAVLVRAPGTLAHQQRATEV